MTLKLNPTEFEIYRAELDELVASVLQFDESSVQIEIKSLVSESEWSELAALISEAMRQMEIEE